MKISSAVFSVCRYTVLLLKAVLSLRPSVCRPSDILLSWGAENAGHENDGLSSSVAMFKRRLSRMNM